MLRPPQSWHDGRNRRCNEPLTPTGILSYHQPRRSKQNDEKPKWKVNVVFILYMTDDASRNRTDKIKTSPKPDILGLIRNATKNASQKKMNAKSACNFLFHIQVGFFFVVRILFFFSFLSLFFFLSFRSVEPGWKCARAAKSQSKSPPTRRPGLSIVWTLMFTTAQRE